MTMPHGFLSRLGDDATPAKAAERLEASARLGMGDHGDASVPPYVYDELLGAAAIRECEAERRWNETRSNSDYRAWRVARQGYDALRNWKERQP